MLHHLFDAIVIEIRKMLAVYGSHLGCKIEYIKTCDTVIKLRMPHWLNGTQEKVLQCTSGATMAKYGDPCILVIACQHTIWYFRLAIHLDITNIHNAFVVANTNKNRCYNALLIWCKINKNRPILKWWPFMTTILDVILSILKCLIMLLIVRMDHLLKLHDGERATMQICC